jgi:hypothetical protein
MPVCIEIRIFQIRKLQQNAFFTGIISSVTETLDKSERFFFFFVIRAWSISPRCTIAYTLIV